MTSAQFKKQQLTKNFNRTEFDCKDGTPVPRKYYDNVFRLAQYLQIIRDEINRLNPTGQPPNGWKLTLNSGYRTESHNRKEGGAKNSFHLTGRAGDIVSPILTSTQVRVIVERLIKEGKIPQGGIGLYPGFLHYDDRGKKVRWTYSKTIKSKIDV